MKNKALENGWQGGRKRDGVRRKDPSKPSSIASRKLVEELYRKELIMDLKRHIEEKKIYFNVTTNNVINIDNLLFYGANLLYYKKFLLPLRSYPLYENQEEYKCYYLGEEFTFYIHSEEEYAVKKSIDDKKFLLENIGMPDTKKQRRML